MTRKIVMDIETTGLEVRDGHRIIEIAAVELERDEPTGVEFHALVNPDRPIPAETTKIHGITDQAVADKPFFAAIARELRDFIGEAQIIITCRTKDGYTLDMAFLNMEMERAGFSPFKDGQWLNVRRWSETMFGEKYATLDKVLDRYGVDRSERMANGHGALLDARLLSNAYKPLLMDYIKHTKKQKGLEGASSAPQKLLPPPT